MMCVSIEFLYQTKVYLQLAVFKNISCYRYKQHGVSHIHMLVFVLSIFYQELFSLRHIK